MINSEKDTIAAIATPPGEGGIAVVRISGTEAGRTGVKLFRTMKGESGPEFESHRIYHGRIHDPSSGEAIDEVLLLYFARGRSFTGDETVEISCHGGPLVARRILEAALALGARPAGPGEYTRRAFMAGKIDLSRAEAVADIIAASSDRELMNARRQLDGELSDMVNSQALLLDEALAEIESRIDFPDEEDISALPIERLGEILGSAKKELGRLAETYREGRVLREGYRVAIVGRPNVGKSSLLNRLLGADRAIVTSEPGTTRDIIEERVILGGVPFILTDTAGIRDARAGSAEEIGAQRAKAQVEDRITDPGGGMLLVMIDRSEPLTDEDRRILEKSKEAPRIIVLNKSDLPPAIDVNVLPETFSGEKSVTISALKGRGLKELIAALVERRTSGGAASKSDGYLLTGARHKAAVDRSIEGLDKALGALDNQPPEIIAMEVRFAREALGEISGATLADDILDIIFSRFCIGK